MTRIEDYALLSDGQSAGLVSRAGSVDWLGFPRFDSAACFARLLGDEENGHWSLAPVGGSTPTRCYRDGTLVLETEHRTDTGVVAVIDALVVRDGPSANRHRLVRIVEGRRGSVGMRTELRVRFDYGSRVPWVRRVDGDLHAVGGPDGLVLRTPVALEPEGFATVGEFTVSDGERITFDLAWFEPHGEQPDPIDAEAAMTDTIEWWRAWSARLTYDGAYRDDVRASLVVLKGLTHRATGAFVAAPTTSLPEWIGGARNWDYRYCWLRDATFTLAALLQGGCVDEAVQWRDWLLRAVAGDPSKVQIMYGVAGERRLPEVELPWLAGYEGSQPVRVGNGAYDQVQLDVFGEVMDSLHLARRHGMEVDGDAWEMQKVMLEWLEGNWRRPDEGIWEVRGERAHYTHSKVLSWVAFDRAVAAVEQVGLSGDAATWRARRDEIHAEVCERAVDERGVFTQAYGSSNLDAANLVIPLVGFLPADDPRVVATVEAIRRELTVDGFVRRYATGDGFDDGVGGDEGVFLLCSFWLVDALALLGRQKEAITAYERLLDLRNDVGLLAEEYDPGAGRQLGNFPQAFSHIAIANSAITLCERHTGPSEERAAR